MKSVGLTGDTMAHGTRINGTAYGITGGKCLVNGTTYSIKKGRTLIGGTGYDVNFAKETKVIIIEDNTGKFNTIKINNTSYFDAGTHNFPIGENVDLYLFSYDGVTVNGSSVGQRYSENVTGKTVRLSGFRGIIAEIE